MIDKIRRVAVLGAGVMGSGIAAHLANAGIPSLLLDIVPPKAAEGEDTTSAAFRNKFAAGALEKLKKSRPAALLTARDLDLIEIGNFEDDLHKVKGCDWIVEVVKEDLAVKQSLFAKIEEHRTPGTIISSNTSGLSIAGMTAGRTDDFRQHFLVTHFFNPVRYMKLLELVSGEETLPEVMTFLARFGEQTLGKGIVFGKDTTNFVANRIGVYGMMKTIEAAIAGGYSVEEVDKIFGPATGRPKSAVFRTADLVGLDTFAHVAKNCYDSLEHDEERDIFQLPAFAQQMVANGWLGDKSKQGFYKKSKNAAGKTEILSLNLNTLEYGPQAKVEFPVLKATRKINDVGQRVKAVFNADDRAGELARAVTLATLAYAARRIPEIADDVVNIDRGMRWGFNWELGPFETWDALGVADTAQKMEAAGIPVAGWVTELLASGATSFYSADAQGNPTYWDIAQKAYAPITRSERDYSLNLLKKTHKAERVAGNASASVWNIGDGVLALEFHSATNPKLNPIDDELGAMLAKAVDEAEARYKGLVIYHDGENFCAGANLLLVGMYAMQQQWGELEKMVQGFQDTVQRLTYSSVPVVAAPAGLALGGGCEIVMGANAIQAAAELYIGLVEVGVGLIPGGCGTLNLLKRWFGPFADEKDVNPLTFIQRTFMAIGMAQVATSAEEAREKGFLRATDGVTLNRDHLLHAAKARVIGMADAGFRPPRPANLRLPGPDGAATIDMLLYSMEQNHQISAHDRLIGKKLGRVLTGGDTSTAATVSEQHILDLEREAFLSLCGEEKTQARIQYMLTNNKPLRN